MRSYIQLNSIRCNIRKTPLLKLTKNQNLHALFNINPVLLTICANGNGLSESVKSSNSLNQSDRVNNGNID